MENSTEIGARLAICTFISAAALALGPGWRGYPASAAVRGKISTDRIGAKPVSASVSPVRPITDLAVSGIAGAEVAAELMPSSERIGSPIFPNEALGPLPELPVPSITGIDKQGGASKTPVPVNGAGAKGLPEPINGAAVDFKDARKPRPASQILEGIVRGDGKADPMAVARRLQEAVDGNISRFSELAVDAGQDPKEAALREVRDAEASLDKVLARISSEDGIKLERTTFRKEFPERVRDEQGRKGHIRRLQPLIEFITRRRRDEGVVLAQLGEEHSYDEDLANSTYLGTKADLVIIKDGNGRIVATDAFAPAEVNGRRIAELRKTYVDKSVEGHGLGQAMTRYVVAKARAAGFERMELETSVTMTHAMWVYLRLGFKPWEGTRRERHAEIPVFFRKDLWTQLDKVRSAEAAVDKVLAQISAKRGIILTRSTLREEAPARPNLGKRLIAFLKEAREREGVTVTGYDDDYDRDIYKKARAEHVVVRYGNGRIAASIAVAPMPGHEDVADLRKMAVDGPLENQGLGTALTRLAIEQARLFGYTSMRLETSYKMKAAEHIYREAGFIKCDADSSQSDHSESSEYFCMKL